MSIIGKVGKKSLKVRTLNYSIHGILIIGALTMIYPFLLMISFSFKSAVDSTSLQLIPAFIHNDEELYKKYMESRFNEESSRLMDNYPGDWISFSEVVLPENPDKQLFLDWQSFLSENPDKYGVYHYYIAEHYGRGIYPYAQRLYRNSLRKEHNKDLREFNRKYNTGAKSWEEIVVEEKEIYRRNFVSSTDGYLGRFREFKEQSPYWMRYYVNPDGVFVNNELIPAYGGDLSAFNKENNTDYKHWNEIFLSPTVPTENNPLRDIWVHYAKEVLNIRFIRLQKEAEPAFQASLKEKYDNILTLNKTWLTSFNDFSEVHIPEQIPDSGALIEDITFFIQNNAQPEHIRIQNIAHEFREYLTAKYNADHIS